MRVQGRLASLTSVLVAATLCGCARDNPRLTTRINAESALRGTLPWNPMQGRVITLWVDTGQTTTSTLYGNDQAIEYARTSDQHAYPAGAIVSLVTWKQKEDERWFGAEVPGTPQSVEFVIVENTDDPKGKYLYQRFEGKPLRLTLTEANAVPTGRAAYLLSQRAAVMP